MDKLTIRDADVAGKRVFVRVDFNVPLADGRVTDDSRIRAAIPTISALLQSGASVILASHLGRPDGKVQDGLRLRPVGQRLGELMRRNVPVTGDAWHRTEDAVSGCGRARSCCSRTCASTSRRRRTTLRSRGGTRGMRTSTSTTRWTAHRAHASTVGIAKLLPALPGSRWSARSMLSKLLEARSAVRGHPRRRQGVRHKIRSSTTC
jgi:phosphoglycerate kinase